MGEPPPAPVGGRGHAKGREIGFPRRIGPVAPGDPVPRRWPQCVAERADADGILGGPALAAIARRRLGAIDAQRGRAAEDRQGRRDAQRIRQAQPMQRLTDRAVVPVFGIGHDRGQRQAGGLGAPLGK